MKKLIAILLFAPAAFAADILDTWTRQDSGTNATLNAVAYGDGLFVAVGNAIITSPDAVTWTAPEKDSSNTLFDVTYANGLWVAVGPNRILVSRDGATWEKTHSIVSGWQLSGVEFANGKWVAVGAGPMVSVSSDGVSWTNKSIAIAKSLDAIVFADGMWVAPHWDGAYASVSLDLEQWASLPTGVVFGVNSLVFADGVFVGVGGPSLSKVGTIYTSKNGISWTERASLSVPDLFPGICYGDGRFVVVSGNTNLLVSTNGIEWTSRPAPHMGSWLNGVTYGDGKFVAVGNGGGVFATGVPAVPPFRLGQMQPTANGAAVGDVLGVTAFNVGKARVGRSIVIESSTNLKDWRITAIVTATNGTARFTDPTPAPTRRFYRAMIP